MDAHRFTTLAHTLTSLPSRRHVLYGLGGLGLATGASWLSDAADAKKKKKKKKGKKGKKKDKPTPPPPTTPPPPPPPPGCTPTCTGKPCGTDDGCGGICGCAAGSVCYERVCQPCTVTCVGNDATCGDTLKTALAAGGTVFACPGRYVGNYELTNANLTLVGAGAGDDPASSTILDANQSGRVLLVKEGATAALHTLRLTGGSLPSGEGGGGVRNEGTLTLNGCTVHKNAAGFGAGILHASLASLSLTGCTVSENTSVNNGGGIYGNAGTIAINGSALTKNKADIGGGVYNLGSTMAINGSTMVRNRALEGGALFNQATTTFDSASRVSVNIAPGGTGGILTNGGTVTLNGAKVVGNILYNCMPEGSVAGCKN